MTAVDGVSFGIEPGTVTGFLGPNGAGKTTTLRMLLGLVAPTSGDILVDGLPYRSLDRPTQTIGAVLESSGSHPGRSARSHLRIMARATGIPTARADEVLAFVGLADAARRKVGGFSMGMRQRLELARALLGDPQILVLDEPANGLDPQGITWLRRFLRSFAAEGRTVLISSHLLAEAAQTVDEVIVLANGRVAGAGRLPELLSQAEDRNRERGRERDGSSSTGNSNGESYGGTEVRVRSLEPERLADVLLAAGISCHLDDLGSDRWVVADNAVAEEVGRAMAAAGVVVLEMASSPPTGSSLEELFFSMTGIGSEQPLDGTPLELKRAAR